MDPTNQNTNQNKVKRIIALIQENKLIALTAIILITIIIMVISISAIIKRAPQTSQTNNSTNKQGQPTVATLQPFNVLETIPTKNETSVYPGEITITIKTNKEILSQDAFSLIFSPALPNYYKAINSYPTKEITAQIYGGLENNTTYAVTLLNKNKASIYTWSFTTSNEQPDSSSQLVKDEEEKHINQFFPLFDYIPYETRDFNVDYTKELTLEVIIKNSNIEKVKKEVDSWIRSHSVDPSTHTINYKNQF